MSDKFLIIPYDQKAGNIPDKFFQYFWEKMQEENLVRKVFYMGKINTVYDFIFLMKFNVLPFMIVDTESKLPVAIAWLSDIIDQRAFAHFCVLKEAWGASEDIGDLCLNFWFNSMGFQLILGLTPVRNRMAVHFLKKIGMTIVGEIPRAVKIDDNFEPAVISYKTAQGE